MDEWTRAFAEALAKAKPVKCETSLAGLIFGHKFYYRILKAGITQTTNFCVRCGWGGGQ